MSVKDVHTRNASVELQTRAEGDDTSEKVIEGYFALFNSPTELFPGYYEEILPGAFDESVSNDVRALIDHDHAKVLGRSKSNTLELKIDSHGLWGSIRVNEKDVEAMNLYERVKRGDVDQCSFGFRIQEEEYDFRDDGSVSSKLKKVELFEVSIVTFPAYNDTGVQARKRDVEQLKNKQLEVRKNKLKERL